MFVSKMVVKGFRSLKNCEIEFKPGKNIIIGKNSCGKSNLIRCLDIIFGEKYPTRNDFQESDFLIDQNTGEKSESFLIFCRVEGKDLNVDLLANQKGYWITVLENNPFNRDGNDVRIDEESVFFNLDDLPYANAIRTYNAKNWCKRGTNEFDTLIDIMCRSPQYYFLFKCTALEDFARFESEIRFIYLDIDLKKFCVVSNITYEFREAFINSAVMPAFREPHNQMRINSYSWYGKLLKSIWDAKKKEPLITEQLADILDKVKNIGEPIYQELSNQVNKSIKIGFSGTTVRFQFVSTARQDIHKQVQVYVDDGFDDLLFRKGSGLQSAFIIGLFTYYCSLKHNTSILVVEEPEAFLHPHARRAISRRLDEFVNLKKDSGKTNQVIVTTHSDEILHVGSVESVTLVRKLESVTTTKTLVFENDLDKKGIKGILKSSASEMFFADLVILCEGAESFVIPRIADEYSKCAGYFDDHNISVISVEGKKSFHTIVRALNKLGIPWKILTDFDFLDYTSERYLRAIGYSGALLEKISSLHQIIKAEVDGDIGRAFRNSSISTIPQAGKDITLQIIEDFKNMGIWILSKGSFEAYLTTRGEGSLFKDNERKIDSSKVAFICRDDDEKISDYFELTEYQEMMVNFNLLKDEHAKDLPLAGDASIISLI